MFYSQCLLSKQGPLRSIWVAAYYHKKLKREQVAETDISSSVDEIILHEVTVTYRVLGYLLLGVVRIYSKKVEYLYHDCTEVLANINTYALSTKNKPTNKAMCASYISITLPERFELDAFDLDILEDISGGSPKPHQQLTLEEKWEDAGTKLYSLDLYHQEEEDAPFEIRSSSYTPVKQILSPRLMDADLVGSSSPNMISKETSMEKPLDNQFPHEARRQLDLFCGDEAPFEIGALYNQTLVEEPLDLDTQCKNTPQQAKRINFLEITPLDLEILHAPLSEGHLLANTMEKTPDEIKIPSDSGAVTPEFLVIRTPAKKEQLRISRKRKHPFDDTVVLSNDVVRQSLHDSSSLTVRRRKAPSTALDVWKACKISRLSEDFLEPLIPCTSSKLKGLSHNRNIKISDTVEVAEVPIKSGEVGLDTQSKLPEQNAVKGEYLIDHSMRSTESPTALDKSGTLTSVSSERELISAIGTQDMGLNLMDEEMGPLEENSRSPDEWSVRTRSVARYLCKSFLKNKDQRENKAFNLASVLEGRTRKESARLFYEILVLKSQGFVDVEQDEPYSDILVLSTAQLEAIV